MEINTNTYDSAKNRNEMADPPGVLRHAYSLNHLDEGWTNDVYIDIYIYITSNMLYIIFMFSI